MSTGRLGARRLALDPAPGHRRARPRAEVPRQRTWQEGRWHDFFHAGVPAAPGQVRVRHRLGLVIPSTG